MNNSKKKDYWLYLILGGIVLFVLFFILAAINYPGGSNFDQTSSGYNWKSNYWCELLGENAKNGSVNDARPFGMMGMISMSIGVAAFWYNIPKEILGNRFLLRTTEITGITSMLLASFIFTNLHDIVIYTAVISGSIAFSLLFLGLYQRKQFSYFISGCICLIMILANGLIYLTDYQINILPTLQKLTFAFTLSWISILSIHFKKQYNRR